MRLSDYLTSSVLYSTLYLLMDRAAIKKYKVSKIIFINLISRHSCCTKNKINSNGVISRKLRHLRKLSQFLVKTHICCTNQFKNNQRQYSNYNSHQLSCDHTTTNNTTLPVDNNTHSIKQRRICSMLNKDFNSIKTTTISSTM